MAHVIEMPDLMRGRELRRIVWGDVAGTVSGDHAKVGWLRTKLAEPAPLRFGEVYGSLDLLDPRHRAEDFLALLWIACPSAAAWARGRGSRWRCGASARRRDVAPLPEGHVA